MILNLFPVRVPIGRVDQSGQVLMTPEFARALASLLERVGGVGSPSLTTVISQLGDVTNIVNSMDSGSSFINDVPADVQALNDLDAFTFTKDQESSALLEFFSTPNYQLQQFADLQILLEQVTSTISDLAELAKSMQDISIQSVFSAPTFSPVALAPDAVDLPTVIALANTLKQALKSNEIGS